MNRFLLVNFSLTDLITLLGDMDLDLSAVSAISLSDMRSALKESTYAWIIINAQGALKGFQRDLLAKLFNKVLKNLSSTAGLAITDFTANAPHAIAEKNFITDLLRSHGTNSSRARHIQEWAIVDEKKFSCYLSFAPTVPGDLARL